VSSAEVDPDELQAKQLSRLQSFLWSITFSKPYDDLKDRRLLGKAGIGTKNAKTVVVVSFFSSFALTIGCCFLFLSIFKGFTDTGVGFWVYLLTILVFFFASHYLIANLLVHYYKSRK
jgi:hypothetical protein